MDYDYYRKLISTCMISVGSFLIIEHIWTFGGLDVMDLIGHESLGLGLIIFVFLWNTKWHQLKELKLWNPRNWFRL